MKKTLTTLVYVLAFPLLLFAATGTVTKPSGSPSSKTIYDVGPYKAYKWYWEASGTQATDDTATIPIKGEVRGLLSIEESLSGEFSAKLLTSGGYDGLLGNGEDTETGNPYRFPIDTHGGGPIVLDSTAWGEYSLDISEAGDGDSGWYIIYVKEEK